MNNKLLINEIKKILHISLVVNTKGDDHLHLKTTISSDNKDYDFIVEIESDGFKDVEHIFKDTSWVSRVMYGLGNRTDLKLLDKIVDKNKIRLGLLDLSRD